MAVGVTLRISADSDNRATFGTDGGLSAVAGTAPRAGTFGFMIDNSWSTSAAADYWYQPPVFSSSYIALASGTAYIWPFMMSRPGRFTGARCYVNAVGAGSTIYTSVYSSDASTGLPSAKITDLVSFPGTATGVATATVLDATTTFSGQALYWMATWAYTTSAYPTIAMRIPNLMSVSMRLPSNPTVAAYFTGNGIGGMLDTSITWNTVTAAPPALSPTYASAAGLNGTQYAPTFWVGVQNV
jgi:hypothetical protein